MIMRMSMIILLLVKMMSGFLMSRVRYGKKLNLIIMHCFPLGLHIVLLFFKIMFLFLEVYINLIFILISLLF